MSDECSIYLDYAASAPLADGVLEAMLPFFGDRFGNPSSVHQYGREARHALEEARDSVARTMGVQSAEIIFTGGGTESNNTALRGCLGAFEYKRLITVRSEHPSVLNTARILGNPGLEVRIVKCSADGSVSMSALESALGSEPAVVSVMHVNNETGAVNPIAEISELVHENGGIFHCDAVQSVVWVDLKQLLPHVDMLSLSGHKAGGPKGIGILFVRSDTPVDAQLTGGAQERGMRAGTENVAAIVGFSAALEKCQSQVTAEATRFRSLCRTLRERLEEAFGEHVRFTVPVEASAPHILHAVFVDGSGRGLDGEMLILGMDLALVSISSGSACSSGAVAPSHVMEAIGLDTETARGAVRISLGSRTTEEDVIEAARRFERVVGKMLRR